MNDEFWKPWEKEIGSFTDAVQVIHDVFNQWSAGGRTFAWRGQVDASWALHSSLYRRLAWTNRAKKSAATMPDERALAKEEVEILKAVHQWGLHTGERGRLTALGQLAVLQHYGSPTRMIDVSFNPLIGLWFAVEGQWEDGKLKDEMTDGRLFAIDVTGRLVNDERPTWEDDLERPWSGARERDWTRETLAWRPPHLDHRIAAQNGGFLFGGVPDSGTRKRPSQWRKDTTSGQKWLIEDVRKAMSIPLHFHKLEPTDGKGNSPANPAYTLRIANGAKEGIREKLQKLYGYGPSTIYRDYSGFALYGHTSLRSRP